MNSNTVISAWPTPHITEYKVIPTSFDDMPQPAVYQESAYQAPAYQASAYQASAYQAPAYQAPVFYQAEPVVYEKTIEKPVYHTIVKEVERPVEHIIERTIDNSESDRFSN